MNMNIQGVNSVSTAYLKNDLQTPLFSEGDVVSAEVMQAEGGRVTLRLPTGQEVSASQRSFESLQPGDQIVLSVQTDDGGGNPKLQLLSVNGQPLRPEVPDSEYNLLRMQILPTRANLNIAEAAAQSGQSVRPEIFARMSEIMARFPDLPPEQALLLSASNLPLTAETVQSFSQWLENPAHTPEFTNLLSSLANASPEAAALLEAAAQQVPAAGQPATGEAIPTQQAIPGSVPLPEGLSEGLASQLTGSGVWQELTESIPKLPPDQAQAQILQFMTDLPPTATGGERTAIFNALRALVNQNEAPAEQAQSAGQTAPEQAVQQSAQQNAPLPLPADGAPAQAAAGTPTAVQEPALAGLINDLFAALDALPPGEGGAALQEAVSGLTTKLRAFTSALEAQMGGGKDSALRPVVDMGQALATQIQMGNEMGNLICMQIPIQFQNQRQEANLFVLKREGRGSQVDESNATIAVCLETQNMGQVDTLLYVERDELSLQFRVDDDSVKDYFQGRLRAVSRLPFPPRYRFTGATVRLRDTAITPTNAGKVLQSAFGKPVQRGLDISV